MYQTAITYLCVTANDMTRATIRTILEDVCDIKVVQQPGPDGRG